MRIAIRRLLALVFAFSGFGASLGLLAGCGRSEPTTAGPTAPVPPDELPQKLAVKHLPNVWRVHDKVISGGLPEGDAAFQEIAELGVKTVISVDGMKPDAELARKHGLRYVHLPHGYDGIPETRARELAKAVRDLPGPIYLHCHHGKHRSPAAAAVACVGAGLIAPSQAEPILRAAGTSGNYQGLYDSARAARAFDQALLDALKAEFAESAVIPPLADAMVALEHTHDHLQQIAAADWKSPPKHPDLSPAHEALLLKEHFAEMRRMPVVQNEPEPFQKFLRDSESAAQSLEDALRADPNSKTRAAQAMELINKNCTACHRAFRDVPLKDKGVR